MKLSGFIAWLVMFAINIQTDSKMGKLPEQSNKYRWFNKNNNGTLFSTGTAPSKNRHLFKH